MLNPKLANKEKLNLLRFITRTGMYIQLVDENGITSFISGFESASNENCGFTMLVRKRLEEKMAVPYSADGWNGQIRRYAYKKHISWPTAFKQIGLEVIAGEGELDDEMQEIVRSRIVSLINRISENGAPGFDRGWIEEWISLAAIKSEWFKKLWTGDELIAIRLIGREIKNDKIFIDWKPFRPTNKLLGVKRKFDAAQGKRQKAPRAANNDNQGLKIT
jgi:hypothetical protein